MPADEILLQSPNGRPPHHILFFITGNPGLIGYYRRFLTVVHTNVSVASPQAGLAVYGKSLGGFETEVDASRSQLYSLQDQIDFVQQSLDSLVQHTLAESTRRIHVTLCGHSVGAYILLRILERFYAARKVHDLPYDIQAGILLFPTIVQISQSTSGARVRWPLAVPGLPTVLGIFSYPITRILPWRLLVGIIRRFPVFKGAGNGDELDDAVQSTAAFLKSPLGLRECM